jgi:hypothetical protein
MTDQTYIRYYADNHHGESVRGSLPLHTIAVAFPFLKWGFVMNISSGESAAGSVMVPLNNIPTDAIGQTRVKVCDAVVREYAAAMREQEAAGGLRFPPVVLFSDGQERWLADGFHRVLAARMAGLTEIAADVRAGTKRDTFLYGISANSTHGLARTNADKRKAVALLLADTEWSQWSNREIARRCQVTHRMVNGMRRRASGDGPQMTQRKVERGSAIYEMNVKVRSAAAADTAPGPPSQLVSDGVERRTDAAPAAAATDALGIPIRVASAKVFAARRDFEEAKELLDRLASLLDRIAQGPAGELYRLEMLQTHDNGREGYACVALRQCRNKLVGAEPYCGYCPDCQVTPPTRRAGACKRCGGRGWTTRSAFECCGLPERQRVLSLRPSQKG